MDGLSAVASVVALVQISTDLISLLRKCRHSIKHDRKEARQLVEELASLNSVLDDVDDVYQEQCTVNAIAADNHRSHLKAIDRALLSDSVMEMCRDQITQIKEGLEKSVYASESKDRIVQGLLWYDFV